MRVKLGQIADVRTGYTIRTELDRKSQGDRVLIQMSDFEAIRRGCIEKSKKTTINARPDWLLEEEDLLLKARGSDFIPVIVSNSFQGAVYTHPLLRIRIDRRQAYPEFIVWFLSQPSIQVQLNRMTAGTSLQMLKLDQLKDLELNLPALEHQYRICEVVRLVNQEQNLLNQLQNKRKQLVCRIVDKLTTEELPQGC